MFTGHVPFDGCEVGGIKERVLRGERPRIPSVDCPREVRKLIKRCWAQEAADRPGFPEVHDRLLEISSATPDVSAVRALSAGGGGDALDALMGK